MIIDKINFVSKKWTFIFMVFGEESYKTHES